MFDPTSTAKSDGDNRDSAYKRCVRLRTAARESCAFCELSPWPSSDGQGTRCVRRPECFWTSPIFAPEGD